MSLANPLSLLSPISLAVIKLEMRFNGTVLSVGTGFCVAAASRLYLITNRHNVTGCDQNTGKCLSPTGGIPNNIMTWHLRSGGKLTWASAAQNLYDHDDNPLWTEHPVLGEKADFVAIPFSAPPETIVFPMTFGTHINIGPAEPVSVVGYPFGLSSDGMLPIWATGFVATEPVIDYNGLPVLLIDCRTRPGQSGSPVIAYRHTGTYSDDNGNVFSGQQTPRHRFLGIYSGRIRPDSDLGMVWKAEALQVLLNLLTFEYDGT